MGQSVYYYGIRCTYEFYNGTPVFVAVASYDNELFSSRQFSYIEGRWAHFLSNEEELTMRAVPPNGSIVFDKTADKLCTAALILFVCHLPILLLVSFIHSIGAFAVSFLGLIASVVLVSIVRILFGHVLDHFPQQLPHTRLNDNYGDYYSMRKHMRDDHGY